MRLGLAGGRHETQTFPEPPGVGRSGTQGHNRRIIPRMSEKPHRHLPPDATPSKRRVHVEPSHPQYVRSVRIAGYAADPTTKPPSSASSNISPSLAKGASPLTHWPLYAEQCYSALR